MRAATGLPRSRDPGGVPVRDAVPRSFVARVAAEGGNGVVACPDGEGEANEVAQITAIAGEVWHEFDEEGIEREEEKAPDEGPARALPFAKKEPESEEKEGQSEEQAKTEDAQLLAAYGMVVAGLRGGLEVVESAFVSGAVLFEGESSGVEAIHLGLLLALREFEGVEGAGTIEDFGVFRLLLGGGAGGDPGLEALAFTFCGGAVLLQHEGCPCDGLFEILELVVVGAELCLFGDQLGVVDELLRAEWPLHLG